MPKRSVKKKRLYEKIDQRRAKYDATKLKKAIRELFLAVDEDASGYLEAHEFVTAQAALAELAGEGFDEIAAQNAFDSIAPFDLDGDSRVSLKEFTERIEDLFQVLPSNKDEVLHSIADCASRVNGMLRRELAREIRKQFFELDDNGDNSLGEAEFEKLEGILTELSKCSPVQCDHLQDLLAFGSCDRNKDNTVSSQEFVNLLQEKLQLLKVPKRDIVLKLQELRQGPQFCAIKFQLGLGRGSAYLTIDKNGWATVTETLSDAVLFKQQSAPPTMVLKVGEGSWDGYYLSADWYRGVGVYKAASDAAYWKVEDGKLICQSFKCSGHPVSLHLEDRYLYCFDEYQVLPTEFDRVTG